MKGLRTEEILENVNKMIDDATEYKKYWGGHSKKYLIREVYPELSIFDWWNDYLSLSQLKKMKRFLETAIKLGFTGYACFKVGAKYCSHGMWAFKNESEDGYSPDGDCIFHSFRSGDNYWDAELNGEWMHAKYATEENSCPDFTLKQVKEEMALMA